MRQNWLSEMKVEVTVQPAGQPKKERQPTQPSRPEKLASNDASHSTHDMEVSTTIPPVRQWANTTLCRPLVPVEGLHKQLLLLHLFKTSNAKPRHGAQ